MEESTKCSLCPGKYPEIGGDKSDGDCLCSLYPCQNGGSCVFNGLHMECKCLPGYGGTYCETETGIAAATCTNDTCHNNGTCIQTVDGGVECECGEYWRGERCQVIYSPSCHNSPCVNNGTCIPGNTTHPLHCLCDDSHGDVIGSYCEVVSPCESSPCGENGACVTMGDGTYTCRCRSGFEGPKCDPVILLSTTTPSTLGTSTEDTAGRI